MRMLSWIAPIWLGVAFSADDCLGYGKFGTALQNQSTRFSPSFGAAAKLFPKVREPCVLICGIVAHQGCLGHFSTPFRRHTGPLYLLEVSFPLSCPTYTTSLKQYFNNPFFTYHLQCPPGGFSKCWYRSLLLISAAEWGQSKQGLTWELYWEQVFDPNSSFLLTTISKQKWLTGQPKVNQLYSIIIFQKEPLSLLEHCNLVFLLTYCIKG